MKNICYLNGRYLPSNNAYISVFDRAYLFSDGIYEVITAEHGKYHLLDEHLERLTRSSNFLGFKHNFDAVKIKIIINNLKKINQLSDFVCYIQISRQDKDRNHIISKKPNYNIYISTRYFDYAKVNNLRKEGADLLSFPDHRWKNVHIKTTSLLENSLRKTEAQDKKALDMLLFRDDHYTETTSANFWIVDKDGNYITRPADGSILDGVTKNKIIDILRDNKKNIIERPINVNEINEDINAFITSATNIIMPIKKIDDKKIKIKENVYNDIVSFVDQYKNAYYE